MIVVDTANRRAEEACLHNTTLLNASSEYIWATILFLNLPLLLLM